MTQAGSPRIRLEAPGGQNQGIPKASRTKNTKGLNKFINTYIFSADSGEKARAFQARPRF